MDGVDSLVNPFIHKPKLTAAEAGLKYAESTLPDVNPGLVSTTGRLVGGALTTAGNILDLPGSSVRDVVDLKNPLDQWLDPVGYNADSNRVSGRQLARDYGLVGEEDNWGNFTGGMAAEIALDPLTYLTLGAGSLTKAGNVVKKTGQANKVKGVANQIVRDSAAKQGKRISKQVSTWGAKSKVTPQMMADTLQGKAKQEFLDDWKRITGDDLAKSPLKDQPLQSAAGLQMNFPFVRGALKKLNLLQDKPFWTDQVANVGTVKDPMGALERWAARHGEALRDTPPPKDPPAGGPGPSGPESGPLTPRNPGGTPEPDVPRSPAGEPVSLSERMREFKGAVDSFDQALAQANAELGGGQPFNGWRPRYQQVRSLGQFRDQAKLAFNLDNEQADAVTAILEARAQTWAETTGRKQEEYFGSELGGVSLQDDPFTRDLLEATGDLQSNKGFASYTQEAGTVIGGFEAADFSTAVHELSHVFHKDLERLAKDSPEVMADLEILAKNFGDEAGNFSQAGREKFARQFERYARDGKAPTKELESVFARVKKWMTDIYKKLKGTPIEQGIKPEVRGVFDRMLGAKVPADRGHDNFVSGMQSGPRDIKPFNTKSRPVGASVQPRRLSRNVLGKLANSASQGNDVFIDSGIATTVKSGKAPDFPEAFESYREIIGSVEPSHRSRLMMVMPDHLQLQPDGKIMGDQSKTFELQESMLEGIRSIQDSGATVIVPIQLGDMGLTEAASMATDIIDFSNGRTAYGIPYNAGKWDDESILELADVLKGSRAHFHLLGGGAKRTDKIRDAIQEVNPDIRVTGDAATEVRNRPKADPVVPPPAVREAPVPAPATRIADLDDESLRKLNKDAFVEVDGETITDPEGEALDEIYRRMDEASPPPPAVRDTPEPEYVDVDDAPRMRYQDVKVGQLKTWGELNAAREAIERHPDNVVGGLEAWDSGASVDLKPAAKRKMAQLQSRMDKIAAAEEAAEEAAEKAAKEAPSSAARSVQELAANTAGPVKTTVSKAGSLDAQMERYNKAAAKRIKSTKVKDVEIGGRDGDNDVRIKGVVGTRIGDSPFIRVTQKNIQQAVDTVPGNKGTATPGLYHEPTGLRLVEGGNVSDHKHLVAMMEDAGIDMVDEKKLTGEQRQKVGKIISAWENDDWSQLPDDVQYSVPERTVPDADFVLDEDTLGHKKMVSRRPAISRTIKAMASENPEFAANPVFNVRGDGKLVYGSYAFSPSAFLPPDAVKKLSAGQTVAVDLEAFNIKPKNTQDALAASFKNAGYKVRKKADSIEVQLGDSKATINRGGEVTGDNTRFVSQVNRVVRSNIAESGGDVDFQGSDLRIDQHLYNKAKSAEDYEARFDIEDRYARKPIAWATSSTEEAIPDVGPLSHYEATRFFPMGDDLRNALPESDQLVPKSLKERLAALKEVHPDQYEVSMNGFGLSFFENMAGAMSGDFSGIEKFAGSGLDAEWVSEVWPDVYWDLKPLMEHTDKSVRDVAWDYIEFMARGVDAGAISKGAKGEDHLDELVEIKGSFDDLQSSDMFSREMPGTLVAGGEFASEGIKRLYPSLTPQAKEAVRKVIAPQIDSLVSVDGSRLLDDLEDSWNQVDFQHDAFPHPDDLHSTGKHMADGSVNDKASSAYQEAVAIASGVRAVGKKAKDKAKEISEIVRTTDPAEIASNALDAVANLWYRLPFGSELTAMLDDTVQGSTAPEGRMVGENVFEAMEESNVQMRRQIKPLIMDLHSTGLFDHSALMRKGMGARDAAKLINKRNNWMLSYLEETNFGSIPFKDLDVPEGVDIKSVQHTLDTMKEILAKQLKIEQEAGIDISNLTDILIKYFPRIKKKPGKSYRLNPDIGQALSASLENSKQRHLVDIPGGTSVLNEMSIDPNISGLMARNPVIRRKIEQGDLQTLRQYVADTYGDRVSTMYNPKHWGGTAKGEHTYFDKVIKWVAGLDPAYQAEQFPVFGNNIIQDLMERLEHGNRSALQLRGAQQLFGMNAIRAADATTKHQIWDMDKALSEINANTDVSYENILGYMDDEIKAAAESHVDTYTESLVSRSMFDPESPGKGAEVKRNGTTHTLQQMEDGSFVERWERTQKMQGNKEEPIYVAGKDNAFVSEDTVRAELSQYGYKDTNTPKEIRKAMREAKEEGHSISFREVPHNKVVAVRLTETRRVAPDQIMDYARELAHSAAVRDFMNNPELGGFGIDKRIGEDLARWMKPFQSPEEVSTFYKGLARITNLMRPALTGPFPSFHFRNFTSGQFTNATYGATDPRYQGPRAVYQPIVDAYQMRSGKPPKGIEKMFDGATPQEAFEKLQSEMFEQNLIGDRIGRASEHLGDDISRTTSQIPGMGSETDPLKALTSLARGDLTGAKSNMSPMPASASMSDLWNPFAAKGGLGYNPGKGVVTEYGEEMFLPYVYGRDVGSFVEDMNRIAPFIAFRRQGYSAKAAADMVKKIQVDYSRLAQWEKKHARAVFPFWTFSSRTLPLTLKEIATNPGGRTATSVKVLSDLQDPDTVAPDYVQETAAIPLGRLSDGSDRYLAGFGLAFEDALNLASGPAKLDAEETLREVASRTTPLVKGPIEWMTQESLFHRAPDGGRDLDDLDPTVGRTLSNLSDWFTGERTKEADPFISRGVEFAVANSPLSRFASTARTMTDTRKWEDPLGLVNLLTGARVTDVSPTARDAILKQRAAHLLKELGAREFKRPYVPDHRLDRMTEEDKVLVGELQELLNTIDQRFRERREAEDAQK